MWCVVSAKGFPILGLLKILKWKVCDRRNFNYCGCPLEEVDCYVGFSLHMTDFQTTVMLWIFSELVKLASYGSAEGYLCFFNLVYEMGYGVLELVFVHILPERGFRLPKDSRGKAV